MAAALGVGNAIMLEAGLSFLGLGVQPPTPSWGNLIASGRDTLVNAPWVAAAPGVALVLVVVAATLLGDAVRDRLDPAANALIRASPRRPRSRMRPSSAVSAWGASMQPWSCSMRLLRPPARTSVITEGRSVAYRSQPASPAA